MRYEFYPPPYRDHTGVYRLDPTLPQTGNVIVGGVGSAPYNAGYDMGWGTIFPRLGIAYRLNDKWVVRTGAGITSDPDSLRFLRDAFPEDLVSDLQRNRQRHCCNRSDDWHPVDAFQWHPPAGVSRLSPPATPRFPVSGSTNTAPANYRRGYIESWNLFVQGDLGARFVANVGYVGTRAVRQLTGYTLNAAPLPSGSTHLYGERAVQSFFTVLHAPAGIEPL